MRAHDTPVAAAQRSGRGAQPRFVLRREARQRRGAQRPIRSEPIISKSSSLSQPRHRQLRVQFRRPQSS
jgi:hypothetical protein